MTLLLGLGLSSAACAGGETSAAVYAGDLLVIFNTLTRAASFPDLIAVNGSIYVTIEGGCDAPVTLDLPKLTRATQLLVRVFECPAPIVLSAPNLEQLGRLEVYGERGTVELLSLAHAGSILVDGAEVKVTLSSLVDTGELVINGRPTVVVPSLREVRGNVSLASPVLLHSLTSIGGTFAAYEPFEISGTPNLEKIGWALLVAGSAATFDLPKVTSIGEGRSTEWIDHHRRPPPRCSGMWLEGAAALSSIDLPLHPVIRGTVRTSTPELYEAILAQAQMQRSGACIAGALDR